MAGFPQFPIPSVPTPNIGNPLATAVEAALKPVAGSGSGLGSGGVGGLLRTMLLLQRLGGMQQRQLMGGTAKEQQKFQVDSQTNAAIQDLLNNQDFVNDYHAMLNMSTVGRKKGLRDLREKYIRPITMSRYSDADPQEVYNKLLGPDEVAFREHEKRVKEADTWENTWENLKAGAKSAWAGIKNISPTTDRKELAREREEAQRSLENGNLYAQDIAKREAEGNAGIFEGGVLNSIARSLPSIGVYMGSSALGAKTGATLGAAGGPAGSALGATIGALLAPAIFGGSETSLDYTARALSDPNLTEAQRQEAADDPARYGAMSVGAVAGALPPSIRPLTGAMRGLAARAGLGATGQLYKSTAQNVSKAAAEKVLERAAAQRAVQASQQGRLARGLGEMGNQFVGMGLMSGAQTLGTNLAYGAGSGQDIPAFQGVGRAMAEGAVTGGLLGFGVGARRPAPARPAGVNDAGAPRPSIKAYAEALKRNGNNTAREEMLMKNFRDDYRAETEPNALEEFIAASGVSEKKAEELRMLYRTSSYTPVSGEGKAPVDSTTGDSVPPVEAAENAAVQPAENVATQQKAPAQQEQPTAQQEKTVAQRETPRSDEMPSELPKPPAVDTRSAEQKAADDAETERLMQEFENARAAGQTPATPPASTEAAAPAKPSATPTAAGGNKPLQKLVDTLTKAAKGKRPGPAVSSIKRVVNDTDKALNGLSREEMRAALDALNETAGNIANAEARNNVRNALLYHDLTDGDAALKKFAENVRNIATKIAMDAPRRLKITQAELELSKYLNQLPPIIAADYRARAAELAAHPHLELTPEQAAHVRDQLVNSDAARAEYEQLRSDLRNRYGDLYGEGTESVRANGQEGAGRIAGDNTPADSRMAAAPRINYEGVAPGDNAPVATAGRATTSRRIGGTAPQDGGTRQANDAALAEAGAGTREAATGRAGQPAAGGEKPAKGSRKRAGKRVGESGDGEHAEDTGEQQQATVESVVDANGRRRVIVRRKSEKPRVMEENGDDAIPEDAIGYAHATVDAEGAADYQLNGRDILSLRDSLRSVNAEDVAKLLGVNEDAVYKIPEGLSDAERGAWLNDNAEEVKAQAFAAAYGLYTGAKMTPREVMMATNLAKRVDGEPFNDTLIAHVKNDVANMLNKSVEDVTPKEEMEYMRQEYLGDRPETGTRNNDNPAGDVC